MQTKKRYVAPRLIKHGSFEQLTQLSGGSYTEMLFGAVDIGNCKNQSNGLILDCVDLGS